MSAGLKITFKKFVSILFLYISTFSWFFFFYGNYKFASSVSIGYRVIGFRDTIFVLGEAVFLICIVVFAFIGSMIGETHDRRKLFLYFTALGVFSTALIWFMPEGITTILASGFVGSTFGISFPLVMAYMSDSTEVEERGRVSGIIVFISFAVAMIATVVSSYTSIVGIILLSLILRSLGFFALALDPCKRPNGKIMSWRNILTYKQFDNYILPFLMFCILSGLLYLIDIPKTDEFITASTIGNFLHLAGTGIFAIIGGFVADRVGRRKPIGVGLSLLGISTAILGYSLSPTTWLIYLLISGFAWGIVFVIYFAVPGDLALQRSQERFYALGVIIPFIAYMSIQGPGQIMGIHIQSSGLFPVLAIVLFISLIPLINASETLPESKIDERQLVEHVEKVVTELSESEN